MSNFVGMDPYSPVGQPLTLSRSQEKVELQQLNDRFAAYVKHVRLLAEKSNQVDSSTILNSTKAMEVELYNLKNMYGQELDKLRKDLESCSNDRAAQEVHLNKQQQYDLELQDRLSVEVEKTRRLEEEVSTYKRRVGSLEAELEEQRLASARPQAELEQLQRTLDNLTRDNETWKHRYDHEQVARQEAENRLQQLMQKAEFDERVAAERSAELQARLEAATATILSLEAKVRDLSRSDDTMSEMLKQVRESADMELRKFQMESQDQYNRNLTALKTQLDNDAKTIERLETERIELKGGTAELEGRILNLEGQLGNLQHQKQALEDAVGGERERSAENMRAMDQKLRELQDLLVVKMRESSRDTSLPIKAEIQALKALLEEEENRLHVSLAGGPDPASLAKTYSLKDSAPRKIPSSSTQGTTPTPTLPPTLSSYLLPNQPNTVSFFPKAAAYTPPTIPAGMSYPTIPVTPSNTRANLETSGGLDVNYIPTELDTLGAESQHKMNQQSCQYDQHGNYVPTAPMSKYMYETSPSLSRLAVEPSPPITPRPAGGLRAKSAPMERKNLDLISANLGQGHDYFDRMFHDLQRDTLYGKARPKSSPIRSDRPTSSVYDDYSVATSSATGDLKIQEVQSEGKYVHLLNNGVQEIDFGGFMLQQNVGGHPVAVFRFPPRTKFAPNSTVTVYAGCNDHSLHNPPTDFVWKEQEKWGTGPECTTILCRPNGQAVAWTTAAHRFSRDAFQEAPQEKDASTLEVPEQQRAEEEELTEINVNMNNAANSEPIYLRRERQAPPSLQCNKHPHGSSPSSPAHPHTGQPRPYYYGNDNSSNNRQSRSQSTRPDPVPGQPYAGVSAQKMGSAPLRKYVSGVPSQQIPSIRGSGKGDSFIGDGQDPPSPFQKPHSRFQCGLDHVQAQHHQDFLPPMPRPPLFSAW